MKFGAVKREESKYAEFKTTFRKNYYAVGRDKDGKSFITTIDSSFRNEAMDEAKSWARGHNLVLEGIHGRK